MPGRDDDFWAEYFGVTAYELRTAGVSIVRHAGLGDYRGVWFFLHGSRLVVSAPESWLEHLRDRLVGTADIARLPTKTEIAELFGEDVVRIVGPTFQGALEARSFRPCSSPCVRPLTDADENAVADFLDTCSTDDVGASALDQASSFRAGYFVDGRVVALAGLRPWSAGAGDICVLTTPQHRGRGCAKAAVSSVLAAAIAADQLAIYQTLEENVPAIEIALDLGYTRYASRIAARLASEPADRG